jgi:hypothetical protein
VPVNEPIPIEDRLGRAADAVLLGLNSDAHLHQSVRAKDVQQTLLDARKALKKARKEMEFYKNLAATGGVPAVMAESSSGRTLREAAQEDFQREQQSRRSTDDPELRKWCLNRAIDLHDEVKIDVVLLTAEEIYRFVTGRYRPG